MQIPDFGEYTGSYAEYTASTAAYKFIRFTGYQLRQGDNCGINHMMKNGSLCLRIFIIVLLIKFQLQAVNSLATPIEMLWMNLFNKAKSEPFRLRFRFSIFCRTASLREVPKAIIALLPIRILGIRHSSLLKLRDEFQASGQGKGLGDFKITSFLSGTPACRYPRSQ